MESRFPKMGKPDRNLLEEYVFGKDDSEKKADRLARSLKARQRRNDVREIEDKRSKKEP